MNSDAMVAHSSRLLTVLAEGDGYVVVAKPAGRIVVPGRGRAAEDVTVRQQAERQLGRPLFVVHRLDRDTSGALLFATDADAHRVLSRAFEQHRVVKHYWALVQGVLMGAGEVDLPLVGIRGGRVRPARPGESGAKPSRTSWRALERIGPFTIVDFRPTTGRLHQIRAHARALGHPLAVDPDYGDRIDRLTRADLLVPAFEASSAGPGSVAPSPPVDETVIFARMPLHARSLKFPHPRTGQPVAVESPLGEDLTRGVDLMRRIFRGLAE